ncbi:Cyclin A/B/D/E [Ostreococcus tauri]|uniref:Cyclin-D n=1 Tax=Ostreococcus tauri TaxID=70448 RepID=CCND_OSTTA|nr:Cyclin A/B/D/E [Ostreococcus tauri]Q5SCB5.1 RecName: Full=Cyclin-D [Ostreococcus tauri]AAV68601.1 cyclin D [Ostreococcus tauri]CEG00769.1 Cyclin A/B/D/E [Ostreococcus tauri]|eukprot:XP_022840571.1 Cyclin A/B/D/E [Ostreococcus tauri]
MNRSRTSSFSTDRSASTVALAPDGDYERERVSALASWPEYAVDALRSEQDFIVHQSAALWTHRTPALHDPDSQETQLDVAKGLLARERETHGSFVFDARAAHHCAFRSQLVEWILDVCAGERFGPTTADVAIAYTDRVLSKTVVPKTSLHLVALCCLHIAVKYEEIEERVPTMSKLRSWTSNMYSPEIIRKMELAVLIELGWDLGVLTPAHFLESFLALTNGGISDGDDIEHGDAYKERYREELRYFVCQLYSLCVQDTSLLNQPPSQIASAVIATARVHLGVKPMCSPELRAAGNVTPQQIYPLVAHMLKLWDEACAEDEAMDEVETSAEFNSLTIQVPKPIGHDIVSKMGYEHRVTENASPTCPFDMQWDEE